MPQQRIRELLLERAVVQQLRGSTGGGELRARRAAFHLVLLTNKMSVVRCSSRRACSACIMGAYSKRSTRGHVWRWARSACMADRMSADCIDSSHPSRSDCWAAVPPGALRSRRSSSRSWAPGDVSGRVDVAPTRRAAPAGARSAVALHTCRSHAMQLSATACSCATIRRKAASGGVDSAPDGLAPCSSLTYGPATASSSNASVSRSNTRPSSACTVSRWPGGSNAPGRADVSVGMCRGQQPLGSQLATSPQSQQPPASERYST